MDFKALRAAKNKKAQSMIESSGGKVDSSDFTPAEPLNADAKTGMRPISRRAFKVGGKVEGAEAKTNLSRAPRGGFKETVGLANTNQKDANEDREGVKHVGGFKRGGMATGGSELAPKTSPRPMKRPADLGMEGIGDSEQDGMPEDYYKIPRPAKRPADLGMDKMRPPRRPEMNPDTGKMETPEETQARLDSYSDYYKRGGAAKKKYEGSPKDNLTDARMAKKKGMTHAEWEKSAEDKRMDAKGQREMDQRTKKADGGGNWIKDAIKKPGALSKSLHVAEDKNIPMSKIKKAENSDNPKLAKRAQLAETLKGMHKADGGHPKDCMCKACGGSAGYKDGGGLYANINAKRERGEKMRKPGDKGAPTAQAFKDSAKTAKKKSGGMAEEMHEKGCTCKACGGRMARATGGRTKGTTNISINVMPHNANKPMGIEPPMPMPPVGGPPPMPMAPPPPPRMSLPPGLGAAMAGAAGAPPMPPAPGAPMPMMGRKSGGKVYPKMQYGSGSGKGRLEKIDEYGKNA